MTREEPRLVKGLIQRVPRGRWFFLNGVGIIVALCSGFSALALKLGMRFFNFVFLDLLLAPLSFQVGGLNVGYILMPAIGALLVGPIINRWAPSARGGGVGQLLESFAYHRAELPARVWPLRLFASAVTIGSGGSGGPEGPVIQAGGTVGAAFGSLLHLTPNEKRILIACGASAGISAFFDAPLGGSVLVMELLIPSFEFYITVPIMIAGVVGGAIGRLVADPGLGLATIAYPASYSLAEYGLFVIFGLIIGLLAFAWIKLFMATQVAFHKVRTRPVLATIVGALLTGLLVACLPGAGIEGDGHEAVVHAITSGGYGLGVALCALGAVKLLATTATVGSGGSAGLLAPGLYIGCMFGGGLAFLLDAAFPGMIQNTSIFFALGMGAFFAAASQDPIGIMIIVIELAGNAGLVLPLMATTIIAFSLVWLLSRGQMIYTARQAVKHLPIKTDTLTFLLNTSVSGYIVRGVLPFHPEQPVSEARASFAEQGLPVVPVLDQRRVVGAVTGACLASVPEDVQATKTVADVMSSDVPSVMSFTKLQDALDKMVELGTDWLVLLHPGEQHEYFGTFLREPFLERMRMADFL